MRGHVDVVEAGERGQRDDVVAVEADEPHRREQLEAARGHLVGARRSTALRPTGSAAAAHIVDDLPAHEPRLPAAHALADRLGQQQRHLPRPGPRGGKADVGQRLEARRRSAPCPRAGARPRAPASRRGRGRARRGPSRTRSAPASESSDSRAPGPRPAGARRDAALEVARPPRWRVDAAVRAARCASAAPITRGATIRSSSGECMTS